MAAFALLIFTIELWAACTPRGHQEQLYLPLLKGPELRLS